MTRYAFSPLPNQIIRLDDMATIPNDPANKDWQEFGEWLEEGNTPEPENPDILMTEAKTHG